MKVSELREALYRIDGTYEVLLVTQHEGKMVCVQPTSTGVDAEAKVNIGGKELAQGVFAINFGAEA